MHTRREIEHILDDKNKIKTKNKKSNKKSKEKKKKVGNKEGERNNKTNNGKYAKGMWTDSPEFNCTNIYNK